MFVDKEEKEVGAGGDKMADNAGAGENQTKSDVKDHGPPGGKTKMMRE